MELATFKGLKPKEVNFIIEYVKDFNVSRAAEAAGYSDKKGHDIIKDEEMRAVIDVVLAQRFEKTEADAEWLLEEAKGNHYIARQQGNIAASNASLALIGKLKNVDAFAKDKLEVTLNGDREIMDRLKRGRARQEIDVTPDVEELTTQSEEQDERPSFF
jgi:hypothetical protein